MPPEPILAILIIVGALVLFAATRLRHDVVAVIALLAVTLTGLIPADQAIMGFGHPAVMTVAAVLLISRALRNAGVVDLFARWIEPFTKTATAQVGVLSGACAFVSGFINNVGALAVLLPVALHSARRRGRPPAILLMPLAFASLLGGLITLIGTPPNIIVSAYRADAVGTPFQMFDISPIGIPVALAGVLFMALGGWRLIPKERRGRKAPEEFFQIAEYTVEVRIRKDSPLVGQTVSEAATRIEDAVIAGVVSADGRLSRAVPWMALNADDVLVLEADPVTLKPSLNEHGLELVAGTQGARERLIPAAINLIEAVVQPRSLVEGRFPNDVQHLSGYAVSVVALARSGETIRHRLDSTRLKSGDVLLLQVDEGAGDVLSHLGLLPLARRDIALQFPRRVVPALLVFGIAIAVSAAGLVPIAVAFLAATLVFTLTGMLPLRDLYEHIDWPIIVLLGAMIPVGRALEETGATALIASGFADLAGGASPTLILGGLMLVTMMISDVVNNAATALVMAPIGLALAHGLSLSPDPFLMGVAVASSCAFLTPIGHQSNTLVMGPAGYRFADYWRLGLPLTVIVIVVALIAIPAAFPFNP